jgi:uncharacterized protein
MNDGASTQESGRVVRLDRAESLRLLAGQQVGRLIFTVGALPAVRLMNFSLVDQLILVRTAADTTVARKINGEIVAFEVDELDAATSSGWSVTVTGRAALVADAEMSARYQAMHLVPWASGLRDQFVTISTEIVEGQRITRANDSARGSVGKQASTGRAEAC